jgi:hypothetical protein
VQLLDAQLLVSPKRSLQGVGWDILNKKDGGKGKKKNKKNTACKHHQKQDKKWKRVTPKEGKAHEKKHNNLIYHWCKHHMTWGNHKETDCCLGQECAKQHDKGCNKIAA